MTKLMTCALSALFSGCLSMAPVWLGSDERQQADVVPEAAGDAAGAGMPTVADAGTDSGKSDAGVDGDDGDESDEAAEGDEEIEPGADEETMEPAS